MPDGLDPDPGATEVLLIDGPLQGARTLLISEITEGARFLVPAWRFDGETACYEVTRGFDIACRDGHVHRRVIAKFIPRVSV